MKMELYYVVCPYTGTNARVGRTTDCGYIAGPFTSWNSAFDVKQEQFRPDNYDVVKHVIEVEE